MNKKGSTSDAVIWIVMLVMMGVLFPIGLILMDNINDAIQNTVIGNQTGIGSVAVRASINDQAGRFDELLDGIFVFIFFGMLISTLIFAAYIDASPATFFIGIVVIIIILVLAAMLANFMEVYEQNSVVSSFMNRLPMTQFIFDNFVFIILVFIILTSIIVWAKVRR